MSAGQSPADLIGKVLAGRYEVTGVLGAGGMGVVVEARQIAVDRKVAIKLLLPSFSANRHAVARFVREMQVTSRLEHPSTVRVYDFGEASGEGGEGPRLFLVMELVHGRTLGKVLAEGRLPLPRIVAIATQIARALEAAHGEGIVHRDLKPDNVMLADRYGAADVVKVLDFGIARFVDGPDGEDANPDRIGKLTAEGAVVGTPAYMSPEQATGQPIGPPSDIYSLGVMLFEMATGSVPFSAPTTVSLMVKHVQEAPPRPSRLAPVPPPLEALILKCLAKDPAARPASARELADALQALDPHGAAPVAETARAGPSEPAHVQRGEGARGARSYGDALAADTSRIGAPSRSDTELALPRAAAKTQRGWLIGGGLVLVAAIIAFALYANRTPSGNADPVTWTPARALDVVGDDHAADATALGAADATSITDGAGGDAVPAEASAAVERGQQAQARKDWPAARDAYTSAIALAPKWGVPRFDLALVELGANDAQAARDALDALIAIAPAWPDARLVRAQAELALRDYAAARGDAEAATVASPDRAGAWFLLGESHRALGPEGSAEVATDAYCKAKALGLAAAAARCP